MFEIISLGRADFLTAVLNGLAILTSDDGPAGYGGLVALGLLIGVVLALGRAIVTQKLELQWVLAGWLLFACLFVPKVQVSVEDIYTGDVTTVANVPLGPAVIGSITSTIGVTLADAFGTVYAFPSMTSVGYLDSLELIHAMRDMDYGSANDGDAGANVPGVDLQRSLRAYLIDCAFYDMSMDLTAHDVTAEKLRESTDLVSAIRVNSNTWFTTLYLATGDLDGQTLTCAEAHSRLSDFMRTRFLPEWEEYIGALLGLADTGTQMQSALDAIFGLGSDAQLYMLNSLIRRELELAEVGYHAQGADHAGVLMRVQAMEQRRTQWAAEHSLWAEMARPAMSFIEGFFYAVSPFTGFLFTLGAPGISLFARYLLLAVWIQLWMPVLAVSNLFIAMAAAKDLQRLPAGGTDLLTMVGLDSVWTETASWLAIGGSMVAATPLLSLILVTGSYFALTSLTNRLSGGDHVDERVVSPAIAAPAPFAQAGAMGMQVPTHTGHPMLGLHRSGVDSVLPHINLSSDLRAGVESAERAQRAAERSWSVAFSTGLDLSHQRNSDTFIQHLSSRGLSGSASQTDSLVERMARSAVGNEEVLRSWGIEERAALQAAIGLAIQKGGGPAARAGIDQALARISTLGDTKRKAIGDRIEHMVAVNSDEMTQLAEKVQQDSSEGISSRFFEAMQVSDASKWAKAFQESQSAAQSFAHLSALSAVAALHQDIRPQAIGFQASSQGWDEELKRLVSTHKLDATRMEEDAGFWSRMGWMDHETASATAAALTLFKGPAEARMDLAELLGRRGFGTVPTNLEDPTYPAHLEPGSTEAIVESIVRAPDATQIGGLRDTVSIALASQADIGKRGQAAAHAFFEGRKAQNREAVDRALAELDEVILSQKAHHYESTFEETRGFLRTIQDFDASGNFFGALQFGWEGLQGAAHAYTNAYQEAIEAGNSTNYARVAGLVATAQGYRQELDQAVDVAHRVAVEEMEALGFPEVVAEYYADQHLFWQAPSDVTIARLLHQDGAFEDRREQARAALGDKAFSLVHRAATAGPVEKEQYLDGALAIYQNRISQSPGHGPVKSNSNSLSMDSPR